MNKDISIEKTREHIKNLRKDQPLLKEKDFRIALGKVIIELRDAKKHDKSILKKLFTSR